MAKIVMMPEHQQQDFNRIGRKLITFKPEMYYTNLLTPDY